MTTLSDKIRKCRAGVIKNPYQGSDKKVLFVCSMGILRSATGARLYAHKYNTRSAGTSNEALIQVNETLLAWADQIVFVNRKNYNSVMQHLDIGSFFNEVQAKSVVLDIPDQYEHMHPILVEAFKEQYEDF